MSWRDKLDGTTWCSHGLTLAQETYDELWRKDGPSTRTDRPSLEVWPEGPAARREDSGPPTPIFALVARKYMWLSTEQARTLARFLVEWSDAMDEAQKDGGT